MTRSVYVIGGAGSGKSTFTAQLLDRLELRPAPELIELYSLPNRKATVTLRGHILLNPAGATEGVYLGVVRDAFPGTDGLDRASSPVGAAWLREGGLPERIIAEGATLATRPFLGALAGCTDLLLVHLWCPPEEAARRFQQRGSNQAASFVANTVTRSWNLARDMEAIGARVLYVATEDADTLEMGFDLVESFLR